MQVHFRFYIPLMLNKSVDILLDRFSSIIRHDQSHRMFAMRFQPVFLGSKGSGCFATSSKACRSGTSAKLTNLVPLMNFQSRKAASTRGMSLGCVLARLVRPRNG